METVHIRIPAQQQQPHMIPYEGSTPEGVHYTANNQYLLRNGKPMIPIMGEFHYSRWPEEQWKEAILAMKSGGIQIIATYVFWIHHEEKEGEWDFTGRRCLREFLQLCSECNMKVWLRIGPWAHGECRNGGFPDWVVHSDQFTPRSNDPGYLKAVRQLYEQIAIQANGMMCRDGGPIIGIQIENEFGHCGGPKDEKEGKKHLQILKNMALELGLVTPYYTVTAWGGAYVLEGETLPVLGGYVDAPWAGHIHEMPASKNFLFSDYKQDEIIGADLKSENENSLTFSIEENPYLTAELGSGLQVTKLRRTVAMPEDIEAQTLCMLGSGANLIGYYMYHGGVNPEGRYSTLQESKETGYPNDLPVKSYDFQACIGESGEIRESYGRLKKLHLLCKSFEQELALMKAYYPDEVPESPEDMVTPRVSIRYSHQIHGGFLFINNHQRHCKMKKIEDLSIVIQLDENDNDNEVGAEKNKNEQNIEIGPLSVKSDGCAILPFFLPINNDIVYSTNATLLCKNRGWYYFYTDQKPWYQLKTGMAKIITLTTKEANHVFLINHCVYLCNALLIEEDNRIYVISKNRTEMIYRFNENGEKESTRVENKKVAVGSFLKEIKNNQEYSLYDIEIGRFDANKIHELYLNINYCGDSAELYENGRLIADWFTTGLPWHVALKRYGYPRRLQLKVYPYKEDVYYDLPVKKGNYLHSIDLIPEYKQELVETKQWNKVKTTQTEEERCNGTSIIVGADYRYTNI